ncbi:50S ribosomal protein L18 [Calditrichota bacterium]
MKSKKKKKIFGSAEKPRLVVFKSLKYIYGQIIDDTNHKVLASISNVSKSAPTDIKKSKTKLDTSKLLGKALGELAVKNKIQKVVFDRNGYIYHGRIKAFADGAREGGLKF